MSEPHKGDGAEDEFVKLLQEHQQATSEGRHQDVNVLSMQMMALAVARAKEEPPSQWTLLMREAQRREAEGNWEGAEAAYRQVLGLADEKEHDIGQFNIHQALARLHRMLGQNALSFQEAQLATQAARRTEVTPLILRALEIQAASALRLKDVTAAQEAVSESFEILASKGSRSDLQRAITLILRAQCQVEGNDLSAVEADLKAAWDILQPQCGALFLAGVHSGLARWWVATARLRTRRNDLPGAVGACREAVDRCRHLATLPQLGGPYWYANLADSVYGLSQALAAAGEVAEAEAMLAESQALRSAIGLPLR